MESLDINKGLTVSVCALGSAKAPIMSNVILQRAVPELVEGPLR